MARPYSLDLRERVVALVARGETCRSVAAVFDVSVASVVKWSQRSRATGSAAAKAMGGKRPRLSSRLHCACASFRTTRARRRRVL